jgi:hypothetical protein
MQVKDLTVDQFKALIREVIRETAVGWVSLTPNPTLSRHLIPFRSTGATHRSTKAPLSNRSKA